MTQQAQHEQAFTAAQDHHSFAPGHMDDDQRPWSVHDGCFFTEHVRRAAGQYAPNEKTRAANADANAN